MGEGGGEEEEGAWEDDHDNVGDEVILSGKSFNLKLSGNEVYCTNALLLLKKIMLCSELHCQKVLD